MALPFDDFIPARVHVGYLEDGEAERPRPGPAATAVSAVVLLVADRIRKWIGHSMVSAIEKLMGLVLTAIAVEMILARLKRYFFET